jgi:uncharacterized protein YjbI with pentapeptide repeats
MPLKRNGKGGSRISRRRALNYLLAGGVAGLAGGCSALAGGGAGASLKVSNVEKLHALINENPEFLNGKHISNTAFDSADDKNYGVILENRIIRRMTMENVSMYRAHLKNVTFVDCTFVKMNFQESLFENVKFIRGKMFAPDRKDGLPEYDGISFYGVKFDRMLFDGVKIGKNIIISLCDGVVVMRNVIVDTGREIDTKSMGSNMLNDAMLIAGDNLHIKIDSCTVKNECAALIGGDNSSSYITNSTFINSQLRISGNSSWIENCTITINRRLPDAKIVVIKKCKISEAAMSNVYNESKIFLIENEYYAPQNIYTYSIYINGNGKGIDNNIYIYNAEIPSLYISAESSHIYNSNINKLRLAGPPQIMDLNLSNVKIKSGDWERAQLRQGKWENVQLGAPIDLDRAKIGTITGRYVEFPNGYPWVNGKLDIVESSQPLKFDKPPVPTLEELGLAQFWKENDFPQEDY